MMFTVYICIPDSALSKGVGTSSFSSLSRPQNQGVVLLLLEDVAALQNLNITACRSPGLWFLPSNNSLNCLSSCGESEKY